MDCVQVGSMEEADKKIEELGRQGKLDPALLLTMAKAYNSTKDTDMTKTEVKDIMAHLYFKVHPLVLTGHRCLSWKLLA